MKKYLKCGALAVLGAWCVLARAQDPALGANVESLLDYARSRNPEYAAMRFEAAAAAERVVPAGAQIGRAHV